MKFWKYLRKAGAIAEILKTLKALIPVMQAIEREVKYKNMDAILIHLTGVMRLVELLENQIEEANL